MFYANQAILRETAAVTTVGARRPIHSATGSVIHRLDISLGALITISILVALQMASLLALFMFTILEPRWMADIDSLFIARLGSQPQLEGMLRADEWITGPGSRRKQFRRELESRHVVFFSAEARPSGEATESNMAARQVQDRSSLESAETVAVDGRERAPSTVKRSYESPRHTGDFTSESD